jgi:hypothetical protein
VSVRRALRRRLSPVRTGAALLLAAAVALFALGERVEAGLLALLALALVPVDYLLSADFVAAPPDTGGDGRERPERPSRDDGDR